MGIETAVLLSYLGTAATVATAGAAVYGAVEAGKQKAPQIQMPQAPPQMAQTGKTADRPAAVAGNAAAAMPGGAMAGNSGTFLTGPGGIDPSSLNLGKNTLLGQ